MMRTGPRVVVVSLAGLVACGGGTPRRTTGPAAVEAAAASPEPTPGAAPAPEVARGPALPPPAPKPSPEVEHAIDRGVLRGLMIEGELHVPADEGTLAAMRTAGKTVDEVVLDVCLAPDGTHSVRVERLTRFRAFNVAVSSALQTWKFRPYVRDGVPARACAQAVFMALDEERHGMPDGMAHLRDALPEPAIELPVSVIASGTLEAGTQQQPPTAGLAIVRVCRTLGRPTDAPAVTFIQSSGDATVDRALLDERIVVPAGETGGEVCMLRSALARAAAAAPTASPGDAPETPQNIAAPALAAQRTAGDAEIIPSDAVKEAIAASGKNRFIVPVKVCLDRTGTTTSIALLKTSGYLGYDADVLNGVATWRHRPFVVNGMPTPVCSAVMFIYKQHS